MLVLTNFEKWVTVVEPVDPTVLRDNALAQLVYYEPEVDGMTALTHVAQLESWFWVDNVWEDLTEEDGQGGVNVEVVAAPLGLQWDPGDGSGTFPCPGPPIEWSRAANDAGTSCGYTFTSGTADETGLVYQAQATIEWELTWSINGVDQGPFGGTPTSETLFEIPVGEVQIVES